MSDKFIYGFGTENVTREELQRYHAQLVENEGGNECQCDICQLSENKKEVIDNR